MELRLRQTLQVSIEPKLELKLGMRCPECEQGNFIRSGRDDIHLICPHCGHIIYSKIMTDPIEK